MKLRCDAVAVSVALLSGFCVSAQSNEALLNKLVQKGILTADEAKELKAESDKESTAAFSARTGMPEWVTSIKFGGDFRGRFEEIWSANDDYNQRTRWRYRLRAGLVATLKEDFEVGFRLGSGDLDTGVTGGLNPVSMNQTLQNNASKKGIFVDQAYAKWSPLHTTDWKGNVAFGKFPDPFQFGELGFDTDYTPEGAALQLDYNAGNSQILRWINGAFILDELSGSNDDPYFIGSQLRLDSKWSDRLSTSLGAMIMVFANADRLANGSVPNVNVGNSRFMPSGTNQSNGILQYNFNPILADASMMYLLDSPFAAKRVPVRLDAAYMVNPAAPSSADNDAWSVGLTLGKAGKRGTWELSYAYRWLGANSIWEEMLDNEFAAYWADTSGLNFDKGAGCLGGTNVRGHSMRLSYAPYDFMVLSVRYLAVTLIQKPVVGDSLAQTFQVDALLKF